MPRCLIFGMKNALNLALWKEKQALQKGVGGWWFEAGSKWPGWAAALYIFWGGQES